MKAILSFIIILWITLNCYADPPNWQPITGAQYAMVVMAEIIHNDLILDNSNGNMAAAFGPDGESDCRAIGVWVPENQPVHDGYWYFTIAGNESANANLPIHFMVYDSMIDDVFTCVQTVTFSDGTTIGSSSNPYLLSTGFAINGYISGTVELQGGSGSVDDVIVQAGNYNISPNEIGDYTMSVIPGIYTVHASLTGYFAQSIQNVVVVSEQTTSNINFTLYPNQEIVLLLPNSATGTPNNHTLLPIQLNNPANLDVEGLMLEIEFDEMIMNVADINFQNTMLEGLSYQIQQNVENGILNLWIYSTGSLFSGSGIILYLDLFILSNAEVGNQTTISINQASVNEIEVIGNSCSMSILGYYNVSGSIHYFNSEFPVRDAIVSLIGGESNNSNTNEQGYYQIDSNPGGNYFSAVNKTTDLGGLSSLDASRIARFGVGLYQLDCYQQIAADVTLNSEITATDASRVARYGTGLITNLNTINKHWVFSTEEINDCSDWPPIQYNSNYQYNPLNADLTEQNFIGIRLGDVTGNWQQDQRNGYRNFQASLPDLEAEQGSVVSVPISVENLEDMEGMDIKIEYDNSILQATGANLTDTILEDNNFAYQVNTNEENTITIWLYSLSQPFSGNGVIANINIDVIGEAEDVSELTFIELNINEENYIANTSNGSITVLASNHDETTVPILNSSLEGNYPNPFNPQTTIHFYLSENSHTELIIFNVKGQKINQLINKELGQGKHLIVWDGKDENQKDLSSGIYFYQLKTEHFSEIKKALLIK
jgi:hypothetical protein